MTVPDLEFFAVFFAILPGIKQKQLDYQQILTSQSDENIRERYQITQCKRSCNIGPNSKGKPDKSLRSDIF
jgi:hypothetical protein